MAITGINSNKNTALVIIIKVAITKKIVAVTECCLCSTFEKKIKAFKTPMLKCFASIKNEQK